MTELGGGVWVDAVMWVAANNVPGDRATGRRASAWLLLRGNCCADVLTDTRRPDASRITLDLGLDVHLEMPLPEAIEYAESRAKVLQK